MFSRRRHPLLYVSLLILVATVPLALFASHSWGGYHWARTSNPFTLKLGDNVDANWDNHLAVASSDWTASSVLNTTIVAGGTRPKSCRPTSGRVEVCNARYGNNGWLGLAQIWITGGTHITQGVTKMNDYYFNTATYNTPAWRQLVMCQEVGHTFGLDHQDENFDNPNLGTCMDYTSDPTSNQHPNKHDYDELATIYSHLDSTTTVGQTTNMPPAMNSIDMGDARNWGQLIRQSPNGREATYLQDFGGGNKILTHVIWAEPRGNAHQ
jgi:hypothetical protein